MPPTENAQLTEPETEALPRLAGADAFDDLDATGPMTLAPRIEEEQRLREHFQSLVDEDVDDVDEFDGERVWQARRVVTLLVAVALLAVTVGITLIGLGGTDQRRPERATGAAAAAAKADAGRSQVTAVPAATQTVAAPAPSASPTVSPSATASPAARTTSASPSARTSPSTPAGRSPAPSASTTRPSPKPSAPAPGPSAGAPKPPAPAPPACSVSSSTQRQLFGYNATATITNKGGKALNGWTVSYTLPVGYIVQSLNGGVWNQAGRTVNVMNGGKLAKGASATISFTAWSGLGGPDAGGGYTLSGTSCR